MLCYNRYSSRVTCKPSQKCTLNISHINMSASIYLNIPQNLHLFTLVNIIVTNMEYTDVDEDDVYD